MSAEPPNWCFTMFAFFGFVLSFVPLPWHLESWNIGTCLYMIWTGLACLNQFINSIVWNSSVINYAPVWCDISARFIVGTSVAIPAASLCINRRLYQIASVSTVTRTKAQKRRDIIIDLCIGIGLPVLEMILQYIPQGHRFNIFEEIGCYPFTYNTPPAYPLVFCWPIAIGAISAVYCVMTIRCLAHRRSQFKELLSANKNLNSSRYFRLMALAGIEVICTIPLGAYSIYLNVSAGEIQPWISWANVHYDFSAVDQFPSVIWHMDYLTVVSLELSRWFVVLCAFIFFGFFGFADEARKHYRLAYVSVAKRVGLSTGSMGSGWGSGWWNSSVGSKPDMSSSAGRNGTMPVFITQRTERKRDSFASFSTSIGDLSGPFDDVKEPPYDSSDATSGSSSKDSLPPSPVDEKQASLSEPLAHDIAVPDLDLSALHTAEDPYAKPHSVDMV